MNHKSKAKHNQYMAHKRKYENLSNAEWCVAVGLAFMFAFVLFVALNITP